ncbi:MAG TPA: PH domain-containing protein [Acidimicrobiales bacterium]|nr:PH domain-containing protein [Acidimicrobiales bacterium]
MAFPSRLLHEGEEVLLDTRLHWTRFAGPATGLVAALALMVALSTVAAPDVLQLAAGGATLLALARFVVGYARWASTRVVLTDRRFVHRQGVLAKEDVEIPLDRVHAVRYRRPLVGQLLRYGDLVVHSGGGQDARDHLVERIARPVAVQREISRQLAARERNRNR